MKTSELIKELETINEWRRGAHETQPNPTHVGKMIDEAIVKLNRYDVALDQAVAYLEVLNEDVKNRAVEMQIKEFRKLMSK